LEQLLPGRHHPTGGAAYVRNKQDDIKKRVARNSEMTELEARRAAGVLERSAWRGEPQQHKERERETQQSWWIGMAPPLDKKERKQKEKIRTGNVRKEGYKEREMN
jgi:hypothetical protein